MELFENEGYLSGNGDGEITLTNYRLQVIKKDLGSSYRNIIFLEDISSIEVKSSSFVPALVLGILLILVGFLSEGSRMENSIAPYSIGTGLALIVFWLITRGQKISITPNGGKPLNVMITKMNRAETQQLIHMIQFAKLRRREGRTA